MKKLLIKLFLLFSLSFPASLDSLEPVNINDMTIMSKYVYKIETLVNVTEEEKQLAYLGDLPIYSPVKLTEMKAVSSHYGFRYHPILKRFLKHNGVDFSAKIGSVVKTTANGTVEKVVYSKYGYGNYVLIRHKNNYLTRYAHLDSINVKKGQKVKLHDKIGEVGITGLTTGPHLHYEIIHNTVTIDPMFFINENKKERNNINYYTYLIALEKI